MEKPRKVDKSLTERLGILRQLDRLKQDNITFAEMDEIGALLQKAGRRAVTPLVRKLWREQNGTLISKYAYLLDFFDDRYWFDQLVQITLRRRDLAEEGKAAFLAVLENCGIDVSVPPFVKLLAEVSGPLGVTLPRLLDKGEEGLLCFMEDFAGAPREIQLAIIRELPVVADPRMVTLLGLLAGFDDHELVEETIGALGRVRLPAAVSLLKQLRRDSELRYQPLITRSLRRLGFLGIKGCVTPVQQLPFHSAFASPVDGAGYRLVWLARLTAVDRLAVIYLQLHDKVGIKGVWGESDLAVADYEGLLTETVQEEGVYQVAPEYALQLLRDALQTNRQQALPVPPEFYVRRAMFTSRELAPAPHLPAPAPSGPLPAGVLAAAPQLFEEDLFGGWYLANRQVYDLADEWLALEKSATQRSLAAGIESIVERFCRDLLVPQASQLSQRLLLNAELMEQAGLDRELTELTRFVADSLADYRQPGHFHPFLRRFAMESLITAREALAEGYDLRDHPEDEDEDWE
ncbi:MAG TPA: HEAT repeat domain-containing protein [Geobacteraceae bacterium]